MNKSIATVARSYPDLETWRTAQRLSQQEAADFLSMSQTTYSRLERRVRFVKGAMARDLMAKTGVSLEVLAGVSR